MLEKLVHYLLIILISSVKFGAAPFVGEGLSMSIWEIILCMIVGMMLTVILLTTLLGDLFYNFLKKAFFKNRKTFSPKSRNIVREWNKRGLIGVAFLTPVLFSPIGGTLISISFGEHKKKIILYMFLSACFWAPITAFFIDELIHVGSSLYNHFVH